MSASVLSSARLILPPPHALFTRMSMVPHRSTAASIIASLSSLRPTSVRTNSVSAPVDDVSSSAVVRPRSSSISAITTRAPSSAKRRAMPLPMPSPPPVITATRWSSRPMSSPSVADFVRSGN